MTRKDKKPAERTLSSLLDAWALKDHGCTISPMVHGSEPLGSKYPAAGFDISFSLSVGFPPAIPDLVDARQVDAVRALVATLDASLHDALLTAGYSHLRPYWDQDGEHFSFAHYFPPGFGGESEHQLACFRPVQEGDPTWGSPFSDEQWVMVRYAGINMFRAIELHA